MVIYITGRTMQRKKSMRILNKIHINICFVIARRYFCVIVVLTVIAIRYFYTQQDAIYKVFLV
jgi:hypothetical protein